MADAEHPHLVLVGLMGAGKTTVGKRIAKLLCRPFVDADEALERRTGRSVRDLFTEDGEAGFRRVESQVLLGALGADAPIVFAAGGGVVTVPANRARLAAADVLVVWLHAEPRFLASRTRTRAHRPLLDGDDPAGTLEGLFVERAPWYAEVADLTVDVQGHYLAHDKPRAKDEIAAVVTAAMQEHEQSAARPGCRTVRVPLGLRSYDVVVGPGARAYLRELLPAGVGRAAIVTQEGIDLEVDPGVEHRVFTIGQGEEAKSLSTVEDLCRGFAQWGLSRADVVIGVGGGVVTDVAGFAAASYHRGVPVVHVATSLLGMVDAAIGGKTGVNLPEGKNLVGAFWQPSAVVCDTDALRTLPPRELRAGWGEVAKYHFLCTEDLDAMNETDRIAACVRIKAEVVAADEREGGRRAVLNYGHTLAHALETVGAYDLRHGEAVAVGLIFAAELARILGRIDEARVAEHRRIVAGYDLPTSLPPGSDPDVLIEVMGRDKKALRGLTFVLDGNAGVEIVEGVAPPDLRAAFAAMQANESGRTQ